MLVTVNAPEDTVGDVIGDLNSRRGRPLGMEPSGAGMTDIKAEVPMAEMLSYAPDLRSITGGQGEFTMEFERYEEVPGHLAAKVVDEARAERDDGQGVVGSATVRSTTISTSVAHSTCDVCGRTLLRGERAEIYVGGGDRHSVCELCTSRAVHAGWVREGTIPDYDDAARASTAGARCSAGCARAATCRSASRTITVRASRTSRPRSRRPRRCRRRCAPSRAPRPAPRRRSSTPRREPRHVRAVPTSIEHKISSAVDAVQQLRAPAHGRRDRALAGHARGVGAAGGRAPERRQRGRRLGAVLVPLRGRPVRRGAQRSRRRSGLRARRARARGAPLQRGRRRARPLSL